MAKITLSYTTFENLVKQLVEMEEGKSKILDDYFPEPSTERSKMAEFIEDYIKQIELLIRDADKSQTIDNNVPFVTIGSEVEIEDIIDKESFKYRIMSPFSGEIKDGDISYLSPVGKSLLLKKIGDEVEVKAPGGVFSYKIISIKLQ